MKTHTEQLIGNLKQGRELADALRRVTPGEGRYSGVSDADVDGLASGYVEVAVRHAELIGYADAGKRGVPKTVGGLTLRAALIAATFEGYRRRGPLAAAVPSLLWGAAHEAIKGYLSR